MKISYHSHTSKVAKDSLVMVASSWMVHMKSNTSIRLKANGISTKAFRNRSAGPSRAISPLNSLSFSSSSAVGAIFNKVWRSSGGSSFPDSTKAVRIWLLCVDTQIKKHYRSMINFALHWRDYFSWPHDAASKKLSECRTARPKITVIQTLNIWSSFDVRHNWHPSGYFSY